MNFPSFLPAFSRNSFATDPKFPVNAAYSATVIEPLDTEEYIKGIPEQWCRRAFEDFDFLQMFGRNGQTAFRQVSKSCVASWNFAGIWPVSEFWTVWSSHSLFERVRVRPSLSYEVRIKTCLSCCWWAIFFLSYALNDCDSSGKVAPCLLLYSNPSLEQYRNIHYHSHQLSIMLARSKGISGINDIK